MVSVDTVAMCMDQEDIRMVFHLFDKNGDGTIQRKELQEALRRLGHTVSEQQLTELMEADADADGMLNYDEFLALLKRKLVKDEGDFEQSELREAFAAFDRDGDGLVTLKDLRVFLRELGHTDDASEERLESMMAQADRDGRGSVDFTQFARVMLS